MFFCLKCRWCSSESGSTSSTAHRRGNHPRHRSTVLLSSVADDDSHPFPMDLWILSPNNQCLKIEKKIFLYKHKKMKEFYFFHLVTRTKSPGSRTILGSSVYGGLRHTAHPCDHSGNQLPLTFFCILYVRVRARFSLFCAICSRYKRKKNKV